VASGIDQTSSLHNREWIAKLHQAASQVTTGCITDAHVLDHFAGMDSPLVEISKRFVIAV